MDTVAGVPYALLYDFRFKALPNTMQSTPSEATNGPVSLIRRIWHSLIKVETLDHHTQGRDNNYNLIRLVAATVVIFGHSYRLSPVQGMREPFGRFFHGTWSGAVAVEAFFFISGLLVCASVIRSSSLLKYFKARTLRLMPGFLVCLLLSVFVLGPWLTDLSLGEYFAASGTWEYLFGNTSLIKPEFYLPGVFEDHPKRGVNGSLWTLPAEARMYLILGVAGLLGLMKRNWSANIFLATLIVIGIFWPDYLPLVSDNPRYFRLAAFFAVGALFFVNRKFVPLNWLALFILLAITIKFHRSDYRLTLLGMSICYSVACVAYLPKWGWPKWMGDYSYGIYIYGWPCQQLAWLAVPNTMPMQNALIACAFCLPLAVLSWHFVEKPALDLKNKSLLPVWLKK